MPLRNQPQLITYPDSLGGSLPALNDLLNGPLAGLFGGVHILPPFPSSGDRGFAPLDYFQIDPAFGGWEDIRRTAESRDVLVDLMVNHISRQSAYFKDFAQKGRRSEWADLFLTLDKVWPGGQPRAEDVAKIFLRRPLHPFADVPIAETGETERVWATFGTADWSEQIDLDVNSPVTRRLFHDILAHFSRSGVNFLRLDAIAFVVKKPGTTCFFVEPEIYAFLDWIRAEAEAVSIELLPEVHADYAVQNKLAAHGFWVYNFILPLLVLHGLQTGKAGPLRSHLRICPRRQITQLDSHDGIPVQPDLNGILPIDEIQAVVRQCVERGANISRIYSPEHRLRPDYDAHQINITYYEALGKNDDAYLTARAVQFFAPGIPQVYYVGLLAGENDHAAVAEGGGRAVNRHNYTRPEIDAALERPVVQRLLALARFRGTHPAFAGEVSVPDAPEGVLALAWQNGPHAAALRADLGSGTAEITFTDEAGRQQVWRP